METINVSQIVGRDLFALQPVTVYTNAGSVAYTVQPGQRVGTVYSWLERDGQIIWILEGNYYQVRHTPGAFDLEAIQEQGGKTNEELKKERENANKTWFERAFSNVAETFSAQSSALKTGITILIIILVVVAAIKIIQISKIDIKKLKPQTA